MVHQRAQKANKILVFRFMGLKSHFKVDYFVKLEEYFAGEVVLEIDELYKQIKEMGLLRLIFPDRRAIVLIKRHEFLTAKLKEINKRFLGRHEYSGPLHQ